MKNRNQKTPTIASGGSIKSKSSAISPILSYSSHNWQQCSSGKVLKLQKSIATRKLTESLEILESAGYSEDIALLILSETQAAWECDQ
ncbi:hypothetical protein [Nostoc sp. FACHB-190]|uniref:hypothetical protein n=1 Tax=Nostoc sp. FACHB-190 TaxID=2692838 RepID=UPI001689E98D|nr:hypothetical protein [Nostoc sp. FACHB-190]MBD2303614.1 hypothetical protein [Nostoc sp. FACHB-190]